jgi:hypothetical protein
MAKNKKQNRQKHTSTNSNVEVSKYIKYGAIFFMVILIAVAIYFIVKVTTKNSNKPDDPSMTKPSKPVKPAGRIKGAWAGTVGCGDGDFNLISLASALPQDFDKTSLNKFLSNIVGTFNDKLSDGYTKYILSIGGSNANDDDWPTFFKLLSSDRNLVAKLVDGLKCRGIVGIDLDLEQTTEAMIPSIINIVNTIKSIDRNFIVMYTIILGSPKTFGALLNTSNYDYLSLMLYNGGMYKANVSGAGCDWDGWAELILSKGTAGCKTPKGPDYLETYVKIANLAKVEPSKVLLGLIIDTAYLKLDSSIMARANELINKYNAAGSMIWVIPGWINKNSIADLNEIGFNINESKCKGGGNTCPPPEKPCVTGSKCIASPCGKSVQSVTDDQCTDCSTGATYWPCGSLNLCQLDDGTKPKICTY